MFGPVTEYGTNAWSGFKCDTMVWVRLLVPAPNVIPLRTTILVMPKVIIMIGLILAPNVILYLSQDFYFDLILVTAPNAFPGSFFLSTPSCPRCVRTIHGEGMTQFIQNLFLLSWVIRWNKIAWVMATQRQEELSVNNSQSFIGMYWYNSNMSNIL